MSIGMVYHIFGSRISCAVVQDEYVLGLACGCGTTKKEDDAVGLVQE
jgi:hypothetical protein